MEEIFSLCLSFGTYGAIGLRNDKVVRMYSDNFPEVGIIEFHLDSIKFEKSMIG